MNFYIALPRTKWEVKEKEHKTADCTWKPSFPLVPGYINGILDGRRKRNLVMLNLGTKFPLV